jgi:hypothetical protein
MTIEELIKKLETFMSDDFCKLYCPLNRSFYFVRDIELEYHNTMSLILSTTPEISYKDVILALRYLCREDITNAHTSIIFTHNDQLFVPL